MGSASVACEEQTVTNQSAAKGKAAEAIVRNMLIAMGLRCVERIETGFKIGKGIGTRRIPVSKVSGDFRAVVPGSGVSVLVEVKRRPKCLRWSDLEEHQRRALSEHDAVGGISLLAWVSSEGVAIMQWPLPPHALRIGLSLEWQQANRLHVNSLQMHC